MPVIDEWGPFLEKQTVVNDQGLSMMAADIERLSKQIAPVLHGHLYSSVRHYRIAPFHWRVSFGEDSISAAYAAYQEFGERRDGSHQVRNYTKPGTGSHFLEIAGSNVAMQAPGTFVGVNATIGRGLL